MSTNNRSDEVVSSVVLIDAEFRSATHPNTFEIPDLEDRQQVALGESVKLIFTDGIAVERMWVIVEHQNPDGSYEGILDNQPIMLPLEMHDPVHFEARNIIEIGCKHCSGAS